jgi:hypothetical protein
VAVAHLGTVRGVIVSKVGRCPESPASSTTSAFTVIMNSAEAGGGAAGDHPVGSQAPVHRTPSGAAYMEIRNVGSSEALVLINRP